MEHERPLRAVPDDELLRRLAEILRQSRHAESDLVAHIGEVDERRLFAREASPSMFAYCTEVLHLSEAEAYLRITAARAAREHPLLLTMLGDGRLHLIGIVKLARHLTPENRDDLLERATHKSKRQIEQLIAEIAPRPDAPTTVRKLPDRRAPAATGPAPRLDREEAPAATGPVLGLERGEGPGATGPALGLDRVEGPGELGPDREFTRCGSPAQAWPRRLLSCPPGASPPSLCHLRSCSRWLPTATRCSSRQAPSFLTSWSGFRP